MYPSSPLRCRVFLFDLDGTLIDSRNDIACALNLALRRTGFPELTVDRAGAFVGDGVQMLIRRALEEVTGREPDEASIAGTKDAYLQEYEAHMLDTTRLYPGVVELLDRLSWGAFAVVTNKPQRFSSDILRELGILGRFDVVLGGDSVPLRKPDPAPLLEAIRICGGTAQESAMIGDSPVDIVAGKAAGTATCAFTGGFRSRDELADAGPDIVVDALPDLARYFARP
jgi:phosphoglycolate phosphatase